MSQRVDTNKSFLTQIVDTNKSFLMQKQKRELPSSVNESLDDLTKKRIIVINKNKHHQETYVEKLLRIKKCRGCGDTPEVYNGYVYDYCAEKCYEQLKKQLEQFMRDQRRKAIQRRGELESHRRTIKELDNEIDELHYSKKVMYDANKELEHENNEEFYRRKEIETENKNLVERIQLMEHYIARSTVQTKKSYRKSPSPRIRKRSRTPPRSRRSRTPSRSRRSRTPSRSKYSNNNKRNRSSSYTKRVATTKPFRTRDAEEYDPFANNTNFIPFEQSYQPKSEQKQDRLSFLMKKLRKVQTN
jgi:hypothetical protein